MIVPLESDGNSQRSKLLSNLSLSLIRSRRQCPVRRGEIKISAGLAFGISNCYGFKARAIHVAIYKLGSSLEVPFLARIKGCKLLLLFVTKIDSSISPNPSLGNSS